MNKIFGSIKNNYILLSLFLIVVLGAILRFKGLTFNSHWLDELYSANFSDPSRSFKSMLKITLEDVHPPVYQTLLWLWYKVFGFTEYIGRSLSAIIGTLSIITIYFLGKELFNKRVGLYAALLVSTNIFLIKYSQEVRSYELFLLLTMLSYMYLHRVIYNPNKTNILLYWITTIILFYTHYFSFFIVATQLVAVVVYIIKYAEIKKQLFILSLWTAGVFIISLLPLVPYILETARGDGLSWLSGVSFFYPVAYIRAYFGGKMPLLVFLGVVISLKYMLTGRLSNKEKYSLILSLIWILVGYLLPYLKGILFSPIVSIRYTISIIPPIILIASYGLWRLGGWKGYLILSIYFIYSLRILFLSYYDHVTKDQYREVLQEVVKYNSVPVYERIPYNGQHGHITNHYQIYAQLLGLDMNIQNDIILTKDLEDDDLPECFWALNAHHIIHKPNYTPNYKIDKSDIAKNPSIHIVKKINYRGAEGVLLSYKTEPGICAKKVGF